MFVNAKIFYRGICPTKEYIKSLEKKFDIHFVEVELTPILENVFTYSSSYVSHVISPGNRELTLEDSLYCTYLDYPVSIKDDWDFSVYPGTHSINCFKGNYQVLTYSRSSAISWLFKKILNLFIKH